MGQTVATSFPISLPWAKGTPNADTGQPTSADGVEQVINLTKLINARITDRGDVVPVRIIGDDGKAANLSSATNIGIVGYDSTNKKRQLSGFVRFSGSTNGVTGLLDIVFPGGIWSAPGGYTYYLYIEFADGSRRSTNSMTFPIFGDQVLAYVGGEPYKDDFQKKLDELIAMPDFTALKAQIAGLTEGVAAGKTSADALIAIIAKAAALVNHGDNSVQSDMAINGVLVSAILAATTSWKVTDYTPSLADGIHYLDGDTSSANVRVLETPTFYIVQYYATVYSDHEMKAYAQQRVFQIPAAVPDGSVMWTSTVAQNGGIVMLTTTEDGWVQVQPYGDITSNAQYGGTARFMINLMEIRTKREALQK